MYYERDSYVYTFKEYSWLAMANRMTYDLVIAALEQAFLRRNPSTGLLHHSDKGSQYTSRVYFERYQTREQAKKSIF